VTFWQDKFKANVERDRKNKQALIKSGWKVIVVWECEIKTEEELICTLGSLFELQEGLQ
jgi:DNA mismatch endonuclease (patch repair protein)